MKPITRLEKLLATAAGEYEGTLPPPETREEIYLLNIIEKINSRGMTPQEIDTAIAEYLNTHDADIVTETELKQELGNYVHKDGNKVLADINYSAAEQAKVTAAYDARHTHDNKAVIDGITAASVQAWNAARANVNADWNANSGDAQILNKPNLSGFITRLTSDLEYYYTKTQTYTQAEVNALVSAIPKFKIEVVQTLPTSNISAATVYLLPDTNADSLNLYTEYIYVNNGWEMLGTQTVDLSGYVTTADLNTALTSAMAAKADASHTHAPSDITGLAEALAGKQAALTFDSTPTEGSANPVTSGGIYNALISPSAFSHNCLFRGKNLGAVSVDSIDEFIASHGIATGAFTDIYVGDYFTIDQPEHLYDGMVFRVAGFNLYMHTGAPELTANSIILVPDYQLTTAAMNSGNTTSGGYGGSNMFTTIIASINQNLFEIFGTHLLKYKDLLSKAMSTDGKSKAIPTSSGVASNGGWADVYANLMSGYHLWGEASGASSLYDYGIPVGQFPLFRYEPKYIINRSTSGSRNWYWLKDITTSTYFACCSSSGLSDYYSASSTGGVRPFFLIG